MHVLALAIDLHLPQCLSLKDKRAALRPVLDGLRNRHQVAVAETAHQDKWQRAQVGVAAVSGSARVAEEIIADAERFVWSFPELDVLETRRTWLEDEG